MPLFRRGEKDGATKTIAIVDIGSGSVGAALARLDRHGPPAILAQKRVEIPVLQTRESQKLADMTFKAASEAMRHIAAAGKPEHIAVFLPAPWSSLYLRTVRLARPKEFRVNPGVVEKMVGECVVREHPDAIGDTVIERSAVGIKLNGYAVDNLPKDALVLSAELTVISVTAPQAFFGALKDEAGKIFHRTPLSFHSTSIAAAYAVSVIAPDTADYLLCNSEGEIAECLLVQDHAPAGSATAPAGCNAILRTLSTHADMARAEASSALALARNDTSPMSKKLMGTLSAAQKECAEGFRAAAKELLASSSGTPRVVYILGNGSEGQWFADAVAGASSMKSLFPGGAAVRTLLPGDLEKCLSKTPAIAAGQGAARPEAPDLFLALEAVFADARFDRNLAFNFKLK